MTAMERGYVLGSDRAEGEALSPVPGCLFRSPNERGRQAMAITETRGRVRVEEGPKRVRTYLGGRLVADTIRPKLVWEVPYYPAYYFPQEDVRMELLTPSGRTAHSPSRGEAHHFTVEAGNRTAVDAALRYPDSPLEELRDFVRFDWDAMDAWFEEDEEVYVHPRDPQTRVDILASSRRIRIEINGVTVAESHQPRLLFETGLPTRYYLPQVDIQMDLLRPSTTTSRCPYKGTASYWSVEAGGQLAEDVVWTYRTPLLESVKIAGLACFYNERVDIWLDGILQERPRTKFS
jgi:uncharacterized protein (DUF427 family)